MATEAQVAANRANAQKSTGPRTAEGKAIVTQNAVKHGLLARAAVLQGEDPEEFAEYREQMLEDLDADGPLEAVLAERVVSLSWRLQRAARNQNAAFEALYEQHTAGPQALFGPPEPSPGLDPGAPADSGPTVGRMLVQDFAREKVLERLLMYERRIESSLYRTMAKLEQRQRLQHQAGRAGGGAVSCWREERRAEGEKVRRAEVQTVSPSPVLTTSPSSVSPLRVGVGTNRVGAEGQLCETNPIPDLAKTEAAEPVGSVPVRAYRGAGILPVVQSQRQLCETNPISASHGKDRVSCDATMEEVGRGRPTYEEPPNGGGTNMADPQGQLCETNPIFGMVQVVAVQGNRCSNPLGQERSINHCSSDTYESTRSLRHSESVTLF